MREADQTGVYFLVPMLQRGNAVSDAPASRDAGASRNGFPRWSMGIRKRKFQIGINRVLNAKPEFYWFLHQNRLLRT